MTTTTDTTIPGADVTVRVPVWLARREGFVSTELQGEVLRLTERGVKLRATAVVRESDHCLRCGREIDHPVSRLAGYGPDCSEYLGIPRDFTPEQLDEIRERIKRQTVVEVWLPRSQIAVVDGELSVRATTKVREDERAGRSIDPMAALAVMFGEDAPPPSDDDDPGERPAYYEGDAEQAARRTLAETPPVEEILVERRDDRLYLFTPFRLKEQVKALAGRRWDKTARTPQRDRAGAWHVPASLASIENVVRLARDHNCHLQLDERSQQLRDASHEAEQATSAKHATPEELPPIPHRDDAPAPWHHQAQAFHFARPRDAAALIMEMGTGKSRVAVDLVCQREHKRVLVVCPRKVVRVWPREFRRYQTVDVDVAAPHRGRLGGKLSVSKRLAQIDDALQTTPDDHPLVVVVNYEAAYTGKMAELLKAQRWDLVILDESHRIKKPGGKWSLFCNELRKRADHRLCLTGTLMPHSPLDVYAQYRFLDPGIFGTSFAAFRNRYAVMGGFQNKEVVAFKVSPIDKHGRPNEHYDETLAREFNEKVHSIAYQCKADDVLDLPPTTTDDVTTVLEPKARAIYDDLNKEMVAEVGDGIVTSANALTKLLRLQQVTSGHLPLDDLDGMGERHVEVIGTEKRELLADTIEDLPVEEPIVVFTRFTHDLDAVREVAEQQGRRYAEVSGRRDDGLDDEACMTTDAEVVGVQIQAGGVGVDLTRARYAVFYSVGFSLGDFDQAVKRVHRPGQTQHTYFYHLVVEATKDVTVYEALNNRRDLVDAVLEEMRDEAA